MWSGPIARITKNSTNWPTANQAWRRLTSSCESGKILTTVCALTKPWDILLPRNSCSSGNANLKRQSVTNLLDEYTHSPSRQIHAKLWGLSARPQALRNTSLDFPALPQTPWSSYCGRTPANGKVLIAGPVDFAVGGG